MHALTKVLIAPAAAATAYTAGIVAPAMGTDPERTVRELETHDALVPIGVGAGLGTLGAQRGTSLLGKAGWGAVGVLAGAALGTAFGAGMLTTKARFD